MGGNAPVLAGLGSSRAAGGAALTISDVESGSLLSGLVFSLGLPSWLRTGQLDLEEVSPLAHPRRNALEQNRPSGEFSATCRRAQAVVRAWPIACSAPAAGMVPLSAMVPVASAWREQGGG